jgi:hypothetical protein
VLGRRRVPQCPRTPGGDLGAIPENTAACPSGNHAIAASANTNRTERARPAPVSVASPGRGTRLASLESGMHEKATRDRPMRGRQRLFFTIAGVIGIVVVAAIGLVIVLIR